MASEDYTKRLEDAVKQMLKPLENIPFNLVIEELANKKVILFDHENKEHVSVLELLKEVAIDSGNEINRTGILRPRPNEVGNDIEGYVKKTLARKELKVETPSGASGKKKSTGYPDLIFWSNSDPFYLECKTYNAETLDSSQRSFYFSPSENFKVIYDTLHFLMSFEIYVSGESGDNHIYKCKHYKIVSLEQLSVDVKYEFNSDNKRMYSGTAGTKILAEGDIT